MIDNALTVSWKHKQTRLASFSLISFVDSKIFTLTSNGTEIWIGAVSSSGVHLFRSIITLSYSNAFYLCQKILKIGSKVFFINTGP